MAHPTMFILEVRSIACHIREEDRAVTRSRAYLLSPGVVVLLFVVVYSCQWMADFTDGAGFKK